MSYDLDEFLGERRSMWGRFVKLAAWTTAGVMATLALMAIFLT